MKMVSIFYTYPWGHAPLKIDFSRGLGVRDLFLEDYNNTRKNGFQENVKIILKEIFL